MASQVWDRDPLEAYDNPFEYEIQAQFVREADAVFARCYALLHAGRHRHSVGDRSASKAVWMLHADALDSLRDALDALERKRHRVAGKLFRNVQEDLDLAAYFNVQSPDSIADLERWYEDEIVLHGKSREHVRKAMGPDAAHAKRDLHRSMSRFVHRSYIAILDGYSLGAEGRLVHDGLGETVGDDPSSTLLVLPRTISYYFAFLAAFTKFFLKELADRATVEGEELGKIVEASLEKDTAKRRFAIRPTVAERARAHAASAGNKSEP